VLVHFSVKLVPGTAWHEKQMRSDTFDAVWTYLRARAAWI